MAVLKENLSHVMPVLRFKMINMYHTNVLNILNNIHYAMQVLQKDGDWK